MGPKTGELIEVLSRLERLLSENDEPHWSKWIVESKRRLMKSDASGLDKLLEAYGGMGSFNDLAFKQIDEAAQTQLILLRSSAWELANEILKELKD